MNSQKRVQPEPFMASSKLVRIQVNCFKCTLTRICLKWKIVIGGKVLLCKSSSLLLKLDREPATPLKLRELDHGSKVCLRVSNLPSIPQNDLRLWLDSFSVLFLNPY